ncbi:MAG: hypothetical protein ACQETK_08800 [Pseudomonadota bacterium]
MSRRIAIQEVRSGQTLASAVHDRSGRLLIPAGMVIQDKQLRVLQSWGISEIEIVDEAEPSANDPHDQPGDATGQAASAEMPVTPEMYARADEILAERFRHADHTQHPMDGVYQLARTALLKQLQRHRERPETLA